MHLSRLLYDYIFSVNLTIVVNGLNDPNFNSGNILGKGMNSIIPTSAWVNNRTKWALYPWYGNWRIQTNFS